VKQLSIKSQKLKTHKTTTSDTMSELCSVSSVHFLLTRCSCCNILCKESRWI